MNFIEFALGLKTFSPKPPLTLRGGRVTIDGLVRAERDIVRHIDAYFSKYDPGTIDDDSLSRLKGNIVNFFFSLFGGERYSGYLYLHGPGGIGKTHFACDLSEFIGSLIDSALHFENVVVTSSEDLEGVGDKPGVFLCVLRNQCLTQKHGSVVFIDEATWLNNDSYISAAKRVFNGQQAKISAKYFGLGIDGEGVKLDMPPMLVIVAGNDEIRDEALGSRFAKVRFPRPNRQALIDYGRELVRKGGFLKTRQQHGEVGGFLEERIATCRSFRDVEDIAPSLYYSRGTSSRATAAADDERAPYHRGGGSSSSRDAAVADDERKEG